MPKLFSRGLDGAKGGGHLGSPMRFGWSGTVGFETATNSDGNPPGKGSTNDPPPINIPEPMSLALLRMGLAGYGATRRRET